MRAYAVWFVGALTTLAIACGDTEAPSSASCTPECRSGFVCALGECISACNPPCARGEHCTGTGSAVACVADGVDGGSLSDVQGPADASADGAPPDVSAVDGGMTDVPVGKDVSTTTDTGDDAADVGADLGMDAAVDVEMDAGIDAGMDSGVDVSALDVATDVTPADVVVDVARPDVFRPDVPVDAPAHCGYPGEACCIGIACVPGAECFSERCVAIARGSAECDHPGVCPSGLACIGLQFCGQRSCYQCGIARGTVPFGVECMNGAQCATGVCDRGRCTTACTIGSTGDSECAARSAGWICAQRIYGVLAADGGAPEGFVTLGSCVQSCARNADCTGGRACLPTVNYLNDRISFLCNTTDRTGAVGTRCDLPEQCQSGLCVPVGTSGGGTVCTAPCVSNSDCPTSAPVCERISLVTPAGEFQAIRGCLPAIP